MSFTFVLLLRSNMLQIMKYVLEMDSAVGNVSYSSQQMLQHHHHQAHDLTMKRIKFPAIPLPHPPFPSQEKRDATIMNKAKDMWEKQE